jgi:malonyl-CoA decarboxylase
VKLAELFGLTPRQNGGTPHTDPRGVRKTLSLCQSLLSARGEVSSSRLATEALEAYHTLEAPDQAAFFDLLIKEFSPNPEQVGIAGDAYRKDPTPQNLAQLQRAVEPPRRELFRCLNIATGGTRALVEMRNRVLDKLDQNPQWEPIAADLAHLFASWFNRGFLVLRRIDWRTSATILEKLIEYEAVHQIQGWHDLRRRLEADRRCYAFFHPALPDEPIIFIEAALTRTMSDKVQPLLDPDSTVLPAEAASCAMFYSITNCQEGLRGVPFGSFLIKQVVEKLQGEFPRLKKFATVSPVPEFREWLAEKLSTIESKPGFPGIRKSVAKLEDPKWFASKEGSAALERDLVPLCAYYLVHAKKGRKPVDPVARFHLRNGARLERINWLGDTSPAGMQRSAGLMANYVYRLGEVERNHEVYAREYKVAASYEVEALARQVMSRGSSKPAKENPAEEKLAKG